LYQQTARLEIVENVMGFHPVVLVSAGESCMILIILYQLMYIAYIFVLSCCSAIAKAIFDTMRCSFTLDRLTENSTTSTSTNHFEQIPD